MAAERLNSDVHTRESIGDEGQSVAVQQAGDVAVAQQARREAEAVSEARKPEQRNGSRGNDAPTPATVSQRSNLVAERMVDKAADSVVQMGPGGTQGSFQVSQSTFHMSQSTFQSTFQPLASVLPGEETVFNETGGDFNVFNSTAPAVVGRPGAPVVPPLWDPHPRSDGFYGWEATRSASASDAASDPGDTLPTFDPKGEHDSTLATHAHWAHPEARTVKPGSGRSGYSDDGSDNQPLVNTSILQQLCSLLNAPETPPGEVERVLRAPLKREEPPRAVARPAAQVKPEDLEETLPSSRPRPLRPQPEAHELQGPTLVDPGLISQLCHLLNAPDTPTSYDHTLKGELRSASPYTETLPARPAFETLPVFESLSDRKPRPRMHRSSSSGSDEPLPSALVDPSLIAQLCSLLNEPETPPDTDRLRRLPLARKAAARQQGPPSGPRNGPRRSPEKRGKTLKILLYPFISY